MITCGDCSNVIWEISILKETPEGYLVMTPNGDTEWLTKDEYINYLNNRKKYVR